MLVVSLVSCGRDQPVSVGKSLVCKVIYLRRRRMLSLLHPPPTLQLSLSLSLSHVQPSLFSCDLSCWHEREGGSSSSMEGRNNLVLTKRSSNETCFNGKGSNEKYFNSVRKRPVLDSGATADTIPSDGKSFSVKKELSKITKYQSEED